MSGLAGSRDLEVGAIQGRTVFSTPLYLLVLPDVEEINAAIAARVLERRATSNRAGAWQSPWGFPDAEWEPLHPLAAAARLLASRLVQGPGTSSWRLSCRATVLAGGQGIEVESTPRADFAATYLVDDGDAGRDPKLGGLLELQDPRGPAPVMYAPDLTFAAPEVQVAVSRPGRQQVQEERDHHLPVGRIGCQLAEPPVGGPVVPGHGVRISRRNFPV